MRQAVSSLLGIKNRATLTSFSVFFRFRVWFSMCSAFLLSRGRHRPVAVRSAALPHISWFSRCCSSWKEKAAEFTRSMIQPALPLYKAASPAQAFKNTFGYALRNRFSFSVFRPFCVFFSRTGVVIKYDDGRYCRGGETGFLGGGGC